MEGKGNLSAKSRLNEFCQRRKLLLPSYDTRSVGPPHSRLFKSTVTVADQVFSGEECNTKKVAEQRAGEIALNTVMKQFEEADRLKSQQAQIIAQKPQHVQQVQMQQQTEVVPIAEVVGATTGKRKFSGRGRGRNKKMRSDRTPRPTQEIPAIADKLDQQLSAKHQEFLPEVNASTAVASLIHVTNELLGGLREVHNLVEFKLTGPYAQGLLTKDELKIDAVVILSVPPAKQNIEALAKALTPMYESHRVQVVGSSINITDEVLSLILDCTYLEAWQADRALYTDPNAPNYVNIDACQEALLRIRQVIWFEPNFMKIYAPNPRIVAKLFSFLCKKHAELKNLSHFEGIVLIFFALRKVPVAKGLSCALRRLFSYLASAQLLPGGDIIINPVKDYKIHIFSKLTAAEELKLANFTKRETKVNQDVEPPEEIKALLKKALEPDPAKVDPLVAFGQKTMRLITHDPKGWEKIFGELPDLSESTIQ